MDLSQEEMAALKDCYRALLYMKTHADELGINPDQIMVGGESAGVEASVDVYHSDMHAFDMLRPDLPESRRAIEKFNEAFAEAVEKYFSV